MNYFLPMLLASFLVSASLVSTYGIYDNPIVVARARIDPTYLSRIRVLRRDVLDKGCPLNLAISIDKSTSITPEQFEMQKNFAQLIINIVTTDPPGNYSVANCGGFICSVSSRTIPRRGVVRKRFRTKQVNGVSNIAVALAFVGFQMRGQMNNPKKIIITGNGFESIEFRHEFVAKRIREDGTSISTVAVGPSDIDSLIKITGDPKSAFKLDGFSELAEIIFDVVNNACQF